MVRLGDLEAQAVLLFQGRPYNMVDMKESQKYMLCPQCGSRRIYLKTDSGEEHYVYVLTDHSLVYSKTGESISEDLDTSKMWCADCAWYGPHAN